MPFAPEYVASVLAENFEDAKRRFIEPLVAIHRAHLVMLVSRGLVPAADARAIRQALDGLDLDALRHARFDGRSEDLFVHVNRLIAAACGEETAGRLHLARSRNDIDMTMYRMRQREALLDLVGATTSLRERLIEQASRHQETLFAAHTHAQPAQPTTLAHYLLAVVEQLERDTARLAAAYGSTNRSPLGACAITGTGFPIDRTLTSDLLGFDAPTGNTYGSIATVDYLLEGIAAASVQLVGLGRFLQDLLLWSTAEFGYLRLADGYVQGSSIMPQKRNPVSLEHARALSSRALAEAQAVVAVVHNTPFGDIVDTEDDLQPLVFSAYRDAARALTLASAAVGSAAFDVRRMAERTELWGLTLTELADTLVRDEGLPFHAAHAVAARLASAVSAGARGPLAVALASAAREVTGAPIAMSESRLRDVLSPARFVAVRRTPGGPAPEETSRALAASSGSLDEHRAWLAGKRAALAAAEARLAERSRSL